MTSLINNPFFDIVIDPYLKSLKKLDENFYEDQKGRKFERQVNPDTGNYWLVLIKDITKEKTNDQIRNPS